MILHQVKQFTISIVGTNDQPVVDNVIYGDSGNEVYESSLADVNTDEEAKFSGMLDEASDDDVNNSNFHYFIFENSIAVGANSAGIQASDISVELLSAAANGWSSGRDFELVSDKFNGLASGEQLTVTFDYKASDWRGFGVAGDSLNEPSHSDIKTVTVILTGTNDQPVVEDVSYSVYESSLLDVNPEEAKFEGQLSDVSDDDVTNTAPRYFINGNSIQVSANDVGITAGDIAINPNGTWNTSKDFNVISEKFNTLGVGEKCDSYIYI